MNQFLLLLAMLLFWISGLRADTMAFESLSDFEVSFESTGSTALRWSANSGIEGGGGLIPGREGYVACAKRDQPLRINPGQSATVSMSFLYDGQVTRIAERNAGVFLTTDSSLSPLDGADGTSLSVYFFNVSNMPGQEQTKLGCSSRTLEGLLSTCDHSLADPDATWWDSAELMGHWLRLTVRFTKIKEPEMWSLTISVLDLGKLGELEREIFHLDDFQINANALYTAPEVFAGFQNLRLGRGFNAMDNLEIQVE